MYIIMSCSNATSPINIIRQKADICDLKCNYQPNYKTTTITGSNKGEYLRYAFAPSNTPPVVFNSDQYNVSDMRLYSPSLHTYNGQQADGELIIKHTNVTQNEQLLVCIPILSGASSAGVADSIISQVALKAPAKNAQTDIRQPSFSISNLIPKSGFYNYTGTLPYSPCNNKVQYVVFDILDGIKIQGATIMNLKKIITASNNPTVTNPDGYYYNKSGPSSGSSGDDDIYIECNPTGADGETIVTEDTSDSNDWSSSFASQFSDGPWLDIFLAIVIGIVILWIVKWILKSVPQGNMQQLRNMLSNSEGSGE